MKLIQGQTKKALSGPNISINIWMGQKLIPRLSFITAALGLVGCGGGGSDSTTNTNISLPTSTTPGASLLQGSVVKGPLNNALVFADTADGFGMKPSPLPKLI
mgnify:CR=1 FL=1